MSNLTRLTLKQARDLLRTKKISSVELTQAFLEAIEQEADLNAFITVTKDQALEQARSADSLIHQGHTSELLGLPLGIKDLFCTQGIRTTAGSRILENFVPPYESTVTQNLLDAGAVFLGKTNMDEFAMGSSNTTSAFGAVVSPCRSTRYPEKKLVPGGSSGGSAAAVAGNLCLAATASDTGGSIRQPASFCGIVGIKPTYGLCSRYGMVAFASSLDQAGPLCKTVEDAALMLSIMASYDEKDATSKKVPIPPYHEHINPNVRGLRVGIVKEYGENLPPDAQSLLSKGISWLESNGAEIVECSLPMTRRALATYYIIAPAEASANLARYDGVRYGKRTEKAANIQELYEKTRQEGFGSEVKRRIFIGTYVLCAGYYDAYYLRAQKIRKLIKQDFSRLFQDVDVILTPTTPSVAFGFDETPKDPLLMYLNDIFTVTVNLAGLPALSVPCGINEEGLPLGLQLIAPAFCEQRLFNVASFMEQSATIVK